MSDACAKIINLNAGFSHPVIRNYLHYAGIFAYSSIFLNTDDTILNTDDTDWTD